MAKKEELTKKYPTVPKNFVERFYEADHTKTKKYFEYFLKTWTNRHQQINFTSPKLIEMVRSFDELLPYIDNKDIYHKDYQKVEDLMNVLVDAEIKRAGKEFVKSEHVQILNETENYIMLRPLTHVGSLKYGANTRWCTASRNNPETFKNYFGRGFLVYCVSKKKTNTQGYEKFALFTEDSRNPFGGEVLLYNQQDSTIQDQAFQEKGWNYSDMYEILCQFRLEASKHFVLKRTKQSLNSTLSSVIGLNFQEIQKQWDYVLSQETDPAQINHLRERLTEAISKFQHYELEPNNN